MEPWPPRHLWLRILTAGALVFSVGCGAGDPPEPVLPAAYEAIPLSEADVRALRASMPTPPSTGMTAATETTPQPMEATPQPIAATPTPTAATPTPIAATPMPIAPTPTPMAAKSQGKAVPASRAPRAQQPGEHPATASTRLPDAPAVRPEVPAAPPSVASVTRPRVSEPEGAPAPRLTKGTPLPLASIPPGTDSGSSAAQEEGASGRPAAEEPPERRESECPLPLDKAKIDALWRIEPRQEDFGQSRRCLTAHFQQQGDARHQRQALEALVSHPTTGQDAGLLVELARLELDAREYEKAIDHGLLAEKYKEKQGGSDLYEHFQRINGVLAGAYQGQFGKDKSVSALDKAERYWKEYRTLAREKGDAERERVAEQSIQKLEMKREHAQ